MARLYSGTGDGIPRLDESRDVGSMNDLHRGEMSNLPPMS